jgi:citronellol/citronellal dehydrogenase
LANHEVETGTSLPARGDLAGVRFLRYARPMTLAAQPFPSLENKVAVITGASRGIGRALALGFARAGADVVLASKSLDPDPRLPGTLLEVKAEVEALGRRALAVKTDVRSERDIDAMAKEAIAVFGGVDVLVNNAGALYWHTIEKTPATRFDLVMQVNARASFLCARALLPSMLARGGGAVINMSPPVVQGAMKGHVAYMMSKLGMTLLAQGIAQEHGEHGVRAFALWPATMIESLATIAHGLGSREMWRTPDVVVDATLALLLGRGGAAALENGGAYYDEDVLRAAGASDAELDGYACVPGSKPPSLRLEALVGGAGWASLEAGRVATR